jgi:hypothetical protein
MNFSNTQADTMIDQNVKNLLNRYPRIAPTECIYETTPY